MDHATEVELIERLLAHMAAGTREMTEREARNPVVDYFDAAKP